jgi:hypothetical protein
MAGSLRSFGGDLGETTKEPGCGIQVNIFDFEVSRHNDANPLDE